ncbi:MAG: aminotransferase class V-fold PLP-dependent enzyme [Acidimicrobiales bacterium]|nr:aminotransferase class V-fold PLP-dependent enzyme [Acidimicrobiales bacterium]MDP6299611.1 aminotransferase class V-fold PLP-dependent enzyme [Acidimicrobiales bacterium]HJM27750.1 aminotransferase class V-fold PLP-dependent enzyme [Acidimicrobiales bacterium]HJM97871.1 aminotransferase class V-fold PLP-dependent enzyme [Acidimicrobiales bacterium]
MISLDLDFVRAQFPVFSHPESASWAHLENAGGSYVPDHVISLLQDFFVASKVQPYWEFGPSAKAGEAMDRSLELLPATFNANKGQVHFGPSTSQNTYVLAQALRPNWNVGDEIIVTNQDHEANIGVWRRLEMTGINVIEWGVDPETGLLDISEVRNLINDKTRLLAVTHASNLAATINPISELAEMVHSVDGVLVTDGVSFAPHAAVDVKELGCDVYLYSTYKTFGPHVGLMFTSDAILERVTNQGHFFNSEKPTALLTPAGPDHAAIAACAGMIDYYDDIFRHHFPGSSEVTLRERITKVFELFGQHEQRLMTPLVDYIISQDDFRLIGSRSSDHNVRAPTVAFHSHSRSSEEIYSALVKAGVSCGHGNFYAHRLVEAVGLDPEDGVVRLSLVHYNTNEEVDKALNALDDIG